MAEFQAHINQAKKNLSILSEINRKIEDSWDWQVTCCYYVGVHLVNAHLAKCANMHYSSHEKVKNALYSQLSPAMIDEAAYLNYVKLENLSRRARYLCKDTSNKEEIVAQLDTTFLTHSVHLNKAVLKVDYLMEFFSKKYNINFDIISLDCIESKNSKFKYFKYEKLVV